MTFGGKKIGRARQMFPRNAIAPNLRRRSRSDRGRARRLRWTGLAEGSLRHRSDEVGHGVERQLPVGVEGVECVETAEHPEHVSGLTDAHVASEGAVVVESM